MKLRLAKKIVTCRTSLHTKRHLVIKARARLKNDSRFIFLPLPPRPREIVLGYLPINCKYYVSVDGGVTKSYKAHKYTPYIDSIFEKLIALAIKSDTFGQRHLPDTAEVHALIALLP